MTETQAPYTASITGGTFTLKVRPTRCEVGEALYQAWTDAVGMLRDLHPDWKTVDEGTADEELAEALRFAETAMVDYFTHKSGLFQYDKKGRVRRVIRDHCEACKALRKAAG